jgi:hypothetical protein
MVFNMKFKLFSLIVIAIGLSSCSAQSGAYTNTINCLGVEMDGSQTLESWGSGRNRFDAVEQAKKNAINEVLFKGILNGKPECERKPLVPEVNAREKYASYFNAFFADGGEYLNYITLQDERFDDKIGRGKQKGSNSVSNRVIVRVMRPDLEQKLRKDGILK